MRPLLLVLGLLACACSGDSHGAPGAGAPPAASVALPPGLEMIFWENQSWESGGGSERLTVWAEGRAQIQVWPGPASEPLADRMVPKWGWSRSRNERGTFFFRDLEPNPAHLRQLIADALAAGLEEIEPFEPDYVDGSGTLIGVQRDGQLEEKVIPMFSDRNEGTLNHRRFQAVAAVLGSFGTDAYEIAGPR